jgi:formylglycine-generating enzyme required for sulfatase activity
VDKIKILFLAANPRGSQLQLDREAREIAAKIRAAEYRDCLELVTRWAVRPDDLQQALLETKPHVLHFSGHGTPTDQIVLVNDRGQEKPVSKEALRHLLSVLKDNLRLVVLNACYSRPQAEAITHSVDCAVGMNQAIGDEAAILFAGSFYRALGFGRSVKDAFELGISSLRLEGIPEDNTPDLLVQHGVDASRLRLLSPAGILCPNNDIAEPEPGTHSRTTAGEFDVFLCHNSQDKPAVRAIAEELVARGLRPWLDEWELRPGMSWQKALETQIKSIQAAAVFVGPSGMGPWQNMEQAAFLREFNKRDCPVIPVILKGCLDEPELPPFLEGMTWADFRKTQPAPIEQLIWGITAKRPSRNKRSGRRGHELTNSINMQFVCLPPGTFQMGDADEGQREVNLTQPFYLGVTEVTQAEYQRVMGECPSAFWGDDNLPVEQVSWYEAIAFCNRLSEQEDLPQYYDVQCPTVTMRGGTGCRLPTEAEWEYACRAGSTAAYCFGDNAAQLGDYASFMKNSGKTTHPVKQKRPNRWGLYDMHGNVWEWCWDWYDKYPTEPQANPTGPAEQPREALRVTRGGSWWNMDNCCRSAFRNALEPGNRRQNLGFRVARSPSG